MSERTIKAKQTAPGAYTLSFDDVDIPLDSRDLKQLLIEVTRVLAPQAAISTEQTLSTLAERFLSAADPSIQRVIGNVDHDVMVMFMKASEHNTLLIERLHTNMSARAQTMFAEDLTYKFPEGVSESDLRAALENLSELIDRILP